MLRLHIISARLLEGEIVLAYENKEYPEWSWSLTRHKMFEECPRKYFYMYYLSHNGWRKEGSKLSQQAYRLKSLTNISLVLGNSIHNSARDLINKIRHNQPYLSSSEIKQEIRDTLNRACFSSYRSRSIWENKPKSITMLDEIYYGGKLSAEKVINVKNNLDKCVDNLINSNIISRLHEMKNSINIKEVDEDLQHININGTKIYVRLDLLYQLGTRWFITDWKTGKDTSQDITDQLALYAMYVNVKYGVNIEDIVVCIESLSDGAFIEKTVNEYNISNIKSLILNSVGQMQSYLSDVNLNKPFSSEAYERTRKSYRCVSCHFREICID